MAKEPSCDISGQGLGTHSGQKNEVNKPDKMNEAEWRTRNFKGITIRYTWISALALPLPSYVNLSTFTNFDELIFKMRL